MEVNAFKFVDLGSATDWLNAINPGETPESKRQQQDEEKYGFITEGDDDSSKPLQMEPVNEMEQATTAPNPQCKESVCTPSFWVPERGLCIYCGYRK